MSTKRYIKLGQLTALISFLLGTVIFGLYFLTSSSNLLFLGYGFIALTGIINIGVLIVILIKAKKSKENKKKLIKTSRIMLINIPIMIVYCWIAIDLLGIMRITFINETGNTLTNINVVGCGGGYIDKLEVGESETIWVDITGDCSIGINYLSDGEPKGETIVGYVTSSMGQKMDHKIDAKNKDIL